MHISRHALSLKLVLVFRQAIGDKRKPSMSAVACTNVLGTASDIIIPRTPSSPDIFSSECTLSNKTYLRRLYMKLCDAQRLLLGASEMQSLSLLKQETGAVRYLPDKTILRVDVSLVDGRGRLWSVQYECVLCRGQRHSRLKGGWAKLCQANKFSVGDKIQFRRSPFDDRTTVTKVDKIART